MTLSATGYHHTSKQTESNYYSDSVSDHLDCDLCMQCIISLLHVLCYNVCNILYCSKVDDQPTFTWVPNDMSLQSFKLHAHSFIGVKRWSGLKVQDYKVNKTFS